MERRKNRTEMLIQELRKLTTDITEKVDHLGGDLYLLRWLKFTRMDVSKAEEMLRQTLEWRRDHRVEELVEQDYNPELKAVLPLLSTTTNNGGPLTLMHVGNFDWRTLVDRFGKEAVYELIVQQTAKEERNTMIWNRQLLKLEAENEEITENSFRGNSFFIDFNHTSIRSIMSTKAISVIMQLSNDIVRHFPVVASSLVLINCHRVLMPVINILKKIVERPGYKIEIYDSNVDHWKGAILKRVHPDKIPTNFGGNLCIKEFS